MMVVEEVTIHITPIHALVALPFIAHVWNACFNMSTLAWSNNRGKTAPLLFFYACKCMLVILHLAPKVKTFLIVGLDIELQQA